MKLTGQMVPVAALSADERRCMFSLMDRHYSGCDWDTFCADLAEKEWVIQVLEPATGQLCGFSTQMAVTTTVEQQPIKALFSGDTIIDRAYWGDQALMHVWGKLALQLIDRWSSEFALYWFLISQGYKSYRFLPLFFHEFYPRFDRATPPSAARILDGLGRKMFSTAFDAATGIVRASGSQYRLRERVSPLTAERLADPHVRFFAEQNPGHAGGDELCCLAPLTRENFTAAAYRVIHAQAAGARTT